MSSKKPISRPSGSYVVAKSGNENVESFIPDSLGDLIKTLDLAAVLPQLTAAERAIGRLDGVSSILPNMRARSPHYQTCCCSKARSLRQYLSMMLKRYRTM